MFFIYRVKVQFTDVMHCIFLSLVRSLRISLSELSVNLSVADSAGSYRRVVGAHLVIPLSSIVARMVHSITVMIT